jgi:lipoyl(octanoyl) transferase
MMDLEPFSRINPCGYPGLTTIDMHTLGVSASLIDMQIALANQLQKQLST